MSLELFCAPESLCSQKVKLVLAEKQLAWKSHSLNLLTFDNLQPDYIRLNPKVLYQRSSMKAESSPIRL